MLVRMSLLCFLFANINDKKYPAVMLPDILVSKLYFE